MNQSWLKKIRVVSALFFLGLSTLLFVDFERIGQTPVATVVLYPQFVPSLLKFIETVSWAATGFLAVLLLTLLFGRVYCSAICPLGTLQDLFIRLADRFSKPRKVKFKPKKPYSALRYGILALTVGLFLSGNILALSLLDPFSNFGRIVSDLLRPLYVFAHNGLGQLLESLGMHGPFPLQWKAPSLATLAFPALFLIGLIWLCARHGRLFCNTLCPVGTLLGLVSQFALFKIRIPEGACTLCVQCSTHCKAGCIRLKTEVVDFSRCVACFNCIPVCEAHGIGYARAKPFFKQPVIPIAHSHPRAHSHSHSHPHPHPHPHLSTSSKATAAETGCCAASVAGESGGCPRTGSEDAGKPSAGAGDPETLAADGAVDPSRRALLRVGATALIGWAGWQAASPVEAKPHNRVPTRLANAKAWPVAPPGVVSLARFNDLCTACHLCVSACPYGVLQPSLLQYGLFGLLQPHMDYITGYCSYECNRCGEICPTGAIRPLSVADKQLVQLGVAKFVRDNCIVHTDRTACGACDEYCPTKAVHMVPYEDGLTIPEVREHLCVGCGACENACPAWPHRAIYVDGHPVQQRAERPVAKPLQREIKDDFPF